MTIKNERSFLKRYAWLSIGAALLTIGMKAGAYFLTGSVSLLSDALEAIVNLTGALMALAMLTIAAQPADEEHAYGHSKAEYFSSGVEGALILVAAVSIAVAAFPRLISPQPLQQIGIGLAVSLAASLINFGVARVLLQAGKRYNSITLEANSRHLMTDVWTSAGVILGVGAVALTGWLRLDPLIALVVATNIIWSGVQIVRQSILGLMDTTLPAQEQNVVKRILAQQLEPIGAQYHALRTRQAGARRFISFHVLLPGDWTITHGHQLLDQLEMEIRSALPAVTILTHLESLDDPASWDDQNLDRPVPSTTPQSEK